MRLNLLALAVGASAFVISERLDAIPSKATLKRIKNFGEHQKERVAAIEQSFYDRAVTVESSVREYLDLPSGQHAFELFEGPHPPPPGKKKPKGPKKGKNPHDQKDKSIYEFIAESEYFTILHDIIKGDEHAVAELNKTSANLTLFAPTNKALEKYEKHAPPIEYLRKILLYHLLPEVYPAGRVLKSKTLETLYHEKELDQKQRLAVDINLKGLTLNYYTRIIYIDVFTNNGVVHAVDNLLFPPPPIYDIAEILPSDFSTFINAAWKTGLVETLNETSHSTVFAPSNFAFAKLGARINAYLFSKRGQPTLTKLIKYHIVPDVLFYSDAVYEKTSAVATPEAITPTGLVAHYEFKTSLDDESINVDVGEWGRFKTIVFNGRRLGTSDIPAKNGVLQKLDGIILPYKHGMTVAEYENMSLDTFISLFKEPTQCSFTFGQEPIVHHILQS